MMFILGTVSVEEFIRTPSRKSAPKNPPISKKETAEFALSKS